MSLTAIEWNRMESKSIQLSYRMDIRPLSQTFQNNGILDPPYTPSHPLCITIDIINRAELLQPGGTFGINFRRGRPMPVPIRSNPLTCLTDLDLKAAEGEGVLRIESPIDALWGLNYF